MGSRSSAGILITLLACCHAKAGAPLGIFEGHDDVGTVLHPGSSEYNAAAKTYTVSGSGENMWFAADAFQFVWKRVSGDVTVSADIAMIGNAGDPHRKAVLMIRQTLDPDAAYADVAVHGNGLTSLQVREEQGAATHEIESKESAPRRVSIVKQGDTFRILVEGAIAGGSMRASITGSYYVGIGVCAHDKDAVQKAVFSNLKIAERVADKTPLLYSTIETINVASSDRRVEHVTPGRATSVSWTADGTALEFTVDGNRQTIPVAGAASPNTTLKPNAWVVRAGSDSILKVRSLTDDQVRVLVKDSIDTPAWSPDGRRLAFVSYQFIQ